MIRVHIRVLSEGAVNVHIAKRDTPASVLNEKDRSNVGMHDRRARISMHDKSAYSFRCMEGASNVVHVH